MNVIDMTGERCGRLVVVRRSGSIDGKAAWLCKCDCGNEATATGRALRAGVKKSCGCLHSEISSATARRTNDKYGIDQSRHVSVNKNKHGDVRPYASYSRLYGVWAKMKQRCNNPHAPNYKNYGARGIRVCDEWLHDFAAFEQWAMTNGYDQDAPRGQCTLDRIDPNGNYCPANCRWADPMTQRHNRRDSKEVMSVDLP